jgi:hypothetical protein
MKILFLDVDGVLNYSKCAEGTWPFVICSKALGRLDYVLSETGCQIVMSSTWRLHEDAMEHLKTRYPRLHGALHQDWRTAYGTIEDADSKSIFKMYRHLRGSEINLWLSQHPDVTAYAIVDDDSDMLPDQKINFVQTTWQTGMLDEHADQLVSILNRSG